jgi:hypothetical protein
MKLNQFFMVIFIATGTSSRHRERPKCHHGIVIDNASSDFIIFALRFTDLTDCALDG